ncbi:hypothetical protein FRC01_011829, partial [Tulasnella sp. 417]
MDLESQCAEGNPPRDATSPLTKLPPEIFAIILQLSLPPPDTMGLFSDVRDTSAYMARLFDFR